VIKMENIQMHSAIRVITWLISFFVLFSLASCGGGGGSSGNSGPHLSLSTNNITFTAASPGTYVPSQSVIATVNGVSGGTLYFNITSVGSAVSTVSNITITSPTTGSATIVPADSASLGAGTHTSQITVTACLNDPTCASGQLGGSPQLIDVTYQIGGIVTSPTSVTLTSIEGETPTPVDVGVTTLGSTGALSTSIGYSATTGWLTVTPAATSSLPSTLRLSAAALPAGSYSSVVTLTAGGHSLPLPIMYNVAKAMAPLPASLNYTIGSTVIPADLSRTMSVGTHYGSGSPKTINWDAITDVPWLSVNPQSGNSSSQPVLTATLVQAQVDQLLNGIYRGNVILSSTTAFVSDVAVPVTLTVDRPQVNFVSPHVDNANTSAKVIIRGRKFNDVNVTDVKFGGVSASSFQVVSDTEIRATHPALAAGQHQVSVVTASGNLASRATLVMAAPTSLANLTFLHTDGIYKNILHDRERNAVLVFPSGGSYIERHIWNGSGWVSTNVTLPYNLGWSWLMSPDGKEIFQITQDNRILRLDAVTLSVLSATTSPYQLLAAGVLNDGNVLIGVGALNGTSLYLLTWTRNLSRLWRTVRLPRIFLTSTCLATVTAQSLNMIIRSRLVPSRITPTMPERGSLRLPPTPLLAMPSSWIGAVRTSFLTTPMFTTQR
jgi:hypothetical protein